MDHGAQGYRESSNATVVATQDLDPDIVVSTFVEPHFGPQRHRPQLNMQSSDTVSNTAAMGVPLLLL